MGKIRTTEKSSDLLYAPELSNLRGLFVINMFLLITLFVMPQYFGIHIGYDITCSRIANVFLVIYSLLSAGVFNLFIKSAISCSILIPLMLYLFVAGYTMVFRVDINAFMLVFLEILTLFMLIFAIRYVIGIKRAIKIIIGCAYFLTAFGFVEVVAGESLFLKFLRTMPTAVSSTYRSGFLRIMGPCGHPLGYGLLLILFTALVCLDYEKDEINIYKRPVLLLMIIGNIFLTGSRSSQGIILLELFLLLLLSNREKKKTAIFYSIAILVIFAAFLAVSFNTKVGRYLLMQIATLIDQVFDTQISVNFGADVTTLQNSEYYREFLPLIFKLDWLNPLVGRGVKRTFSTEVVNPDGTIMYIESIDCYYICQYIKYAYPGLITYCLFILVNGVTMIIEMIKHKSDTVKALFVGFVCYFINLWWVDALQTLKFVYAYIAIFFAIIIFNKDKKNSSYVKLSKDKDAEESVELKTENSHATTSR